MDFTLPVADRLRENAVKGKALHAYMVKPTMREAADRIEALEAVLRQISQTRWNTMTEGCNLAAFAQREARRLLQAS